MTRVILQDALQVPQALAQHIIFCLENKDVIRFENEEINSDGKRCIVLSDIHIPFQDVLSVETALEYADQIKPDIIVILGDLIDFYQISDFVKNPRERDTKTEIEMTRKFLTELRRRFPSADIYYKEGNHEKRLERYIIQNHSIR